MHETKIVVPVSFNEETYKKLNDILIYQNIRNLIKRRDDKRSDLTPEDFITGCVNDYIDTVYEYNKISGMEDLGKPFRLKNRFKEVVESNGIKQKDLSELTNIDRGNLSQILNNRVQPSLDYCLRIMVALKLKFQDIHLYLYREE